MQWKYDGGGGDGARRGEIIIVDDISMELKELHSRGQNFSLEASYCTTTPTRESGRWASNRNAALVRLLW
jgi:hypothetical protein